MMSYAIITAPTPNPNALKFILNVDVKTDGKVTFKTKEEAKGLDLVETLFSLVFVQQVHLFENVVTITKTEHPTDWEGVIAMVKSVLNSRLPNHDPEFKDEDLGVVTHDRSSKSTEVQEIEEVLDRTVRSYLQSDGGDIDVIEYKNNTVIVNYVGACGTCPSSAAGTLMAIQSTLQSEVNPEIQVIAANSQY